MADDTVYTEEELSKMADNLLAAADEPELIPEPPKPRKSSRKKESAEERNLLKKLEAECMLHFCFLLEFHFQEQVLGQELLRPAFWI